MHHLHALFAKNLWTILLAALGNAYPLVIVTGVYLDSEVTRNTRSVFLKFNDDLVPIIGGTYREPRSGIIVFSAGTGTMYRCIINLHSLLLRAVIYAVKVKISFRIKIDRLGRCADCHIGFRNFDSI